MTLSLYEDALAPLQDHLPEWWAKGASAPSLLYTNLISDPSAEIGVSGWGSDQGSLVQSTDAAAGWPVAGTNSFKVTRTTAGVGSLNCYRTTPVAGSIYYPVVAGRTYVTSCYVRAATTGRSVAIRLQWVDAAGSFISETAGVAITDSTGAQRISVAATAPGNAASARAVTEWTLCANGEVHYADAFQLVEATTPPGYFDGDTDPARTTRWTGTPHASTSEVYAGSLTPPSAASTLYAFLVALAQPIDGLSADLENVHADMALVNATINGLRSEYAYAYGIGFEQLPPTSDALRSYIETWVGVNGSTASIITALTALLTTSINTTGTQLFFDAGGAGLTFPANGTGISPLFQTVNIVANLSFPVDGTGVVLSTTFPNTSGWVLVGESPSSFTWTVTTKSYLNFDRAAFARAVERLRQAHLLPATIIEIST